MSLRVDTVGWVAGLPTLASSATIRAGGREVRFDNSDEWWSREPVTDPKK
jgi:hypothetical protein